MFEVKIFTSKGTRVLYVGTEMIHAYEFFAETMYVLEMSGGTATLDLKDGEILRNQVYIENGERVVTEE